MQLMLFRHLWGVGDPWERAFGEFVQEGYTGIETGLPQDDQAARFRDLLSAHQLGYIAQIFTGGQTVAEHIDSFRRQLERAASFSPRTVVCHGGSDVFSPQEAEQFFREAVRIETAVGLPVAHETHRGRILFHPRITAAMLEALDGLKLCCDFSHWVCVCERLIHDQVDVIRQCARRALHLHARVGYEEGPQVPDPTAPEYQRHVEAHEQWWDLVWDAQAEAGVQVSTLTPEFGPPGYLHTLPHTNVPVAHLRSICNWQARRQAERFVRRFA